MLHSQPDNNAQRARRTCAGAVASVVVLSLVCQPALPTCLTLNRCHRLRLKPKTGERNDIDLGRDVPPTMISMNAKFLLSKHRHKSIHWISP